MKKILSVIFVAAATVAVNAYGAASGSIVFDPTNYLQTTSSAISNAKTALQAIQQTRQQFETYKQQYAATKKLIDDIKGLKVDKLLAITNPAAAQQIQQLRTAASDVTRVIGDLEQSRTMFTSKLNAASLSGKPLDLFVAKQYAEAAQGNVAAKATIQRDLDVLKSAQKSAEAAAGWRQEIGGLSNNLGGAMQLLNTSLASVVSTNADILAYSAQKSADATKAAAAANEKRLLTDVGNSDARNASIASEKSSLDNLNKLGTDWVDPWKVK